MKTLAVNFNFDSDGFIKHYESSRQQLTWKIKFIFKKKTQINTIRKKRKINEREGEGKRERRKAGEGEKDFEKQKIPLLFRGYLFST